MPTRSLAAAIAVIAVAALAACGGGASSSSTSPTTRTSEALVSFEREGGIAYSRIELVVDAGGDAHVVISTAPTKRNARSVTVDDAELARLRRLIDATPLAGLPQTPPTGCADCYRYRLAYGGARYTTDEASIPARLRPVVAELETIAGVGAGGK